MCREIPGDAAGIHQPLLDCRRLLYRFVIRLFVVGALLEKLFEWRHDTDADTIIVQRNVPEPTLAVRGLQHDCRAFVLAGVAICAFPVSPDRSLVEDRIPDPQLEFVLQNSTLAAGV